MEDKKNDVLASTCAQILQHCYRNITDVMLRIKEVSCQLLTPFAHFHETYPMFAHYMWNTQSQSQMIHDEFPDMLRHMA